MSTPTSGHYEQVNGSPVVRFERTFPHPVAAVWEAITDRAQLEQWFPTTVEFSELQAGAPIVFRFAEDRYPPMTGTVLELEHQRRLAFSWGDDRLTFELEARQAGSACRLALTVVLDSADKAARDSAGWESCLDGLEQVAARECPAGPRLERAVEHYYEEYKRLGLPATAPILH